MCRVRVPALDGVSLRPRAVAKAANRIKGRDGGRTRVRTVEAGKKGRERRLRLLHLLNRSGNL
jgi:hypothetical protein